MTNMAAGRPPYDRVSLGAGFYNRYMAPLGLVLLFLTGFGPLIAWRKSSTESLVRQFLAPLVVGGVAGVTAFFWVKSAHGVALGIAGTTCFALCGFTLWTIVQEFYRGVVVRRRNRPQSVLDALIGLVTKARRRYGGYIVHLGVVLMFFGWAGNAYNIERKLSMHKGDVVDLGPYQVRHDGAAASEDWQKDMLMVNFTVLHNGEVVDHLTPGKWWYYQSPEMPTSEASRHMTIGGDAYISIDDVELTGREWTRVNLYYNPLVNWVWVGFGIMILGGIVCIGTRKTEGAAQ